jgi:hypothetical protein
MLEKSERSIKNGQFRETKGTQDDEKQNHNTICVGHRYM